MKTLYRVLNGMKAAGVPKKFGEAEIALRRIRLEKARQVRLARLRERRERVARQKKLVKDMAGLGVFVPVEDFE